MSTATSQRKYLPVGGATETDLDYAQHFVDVATAVDGCVRSEDVALLLSTCRNHWMTTNAIFVDLRRALGSGDYPDSVSAALYELRRGSGREAIKQLDKAGEYLSYARKKLKVWEDRELLFRQLDESIDRLSGLGQARVREMLREQRSKAPAPGGVEHIKYLVLCDREEPICIEKIRMLREVMEGLTILRDVIREVAALRGEGQGSLLEPSLEERHPSQALVESLLADPKGWGLELEGESEIRFGVEAENSFDPFGKNDANAWLALVGHLNEVALERLVRLQQKIVENFKANVETAPMPEPYIIDLSVGRVSGAGDEYEVKMHRVAGDSPPNEARVALLEWPIPNDAYNNTDLCRFKEADTREKVKTVVSAAVHKASAEGAALLVLPELCIPSELVNELEDLSRELKIGVVAGREHRALEDGRIVNDVLVHIPRLPGRVEQHKQHPSVLEPIRERFHTDQRINVFSGTALGTMMVVVCSDYLEHDVVTQAWSEHHVDTLVVCARNPNPKVFERLAVADAIREFCNVIVANAYPGDEDSGKAPSGDGTLIAVPRRDDPLIQLKVEELDVDWTLGAKPALALADLNMKAIYSRSHGRSDHGYLQPSHFASRR